ncbi:hypothetical protein ACE7GA_11765 [Roseomonas sp. CCTCC AB2023176]|uniref:hypothetical protein n=1 Tax=Roseomonas sp. CCTCC AB2023176 TaxID=3342640 RepID=UPI0035DF4951
MLSHVTSLARKVVLPAALALGALVAAPSVGPAQAASGVTLSVLSDPAVVPVDWRHRHHGPRYYAPPPPPPPWYYRRPAYGPRYYAPPPPPRHYGHHGPRYYYR